MAYENSVHRAQRPIRGGRHFNLPKTGRYNTPPYPISFTEAPTQRPRAYSATQLDLTSTTAGGMPASRKPTSGRASSERRQATKNSGDKPRRLEARH